MNTLVIAISEERGIVGYRKPDGTTGIPWSMIQADNAWFRGLCANSNLAVGRTTYDELAKFLPGWTARSVAVHTSRTIPDHPSDRVYACDFGRPNTDYLIIGGLSTHNAYLDRNYVHHASVTLVPESRVDTIDGEYIADPELLARLQRDFNLKRVLTWTQDCKIMFGPRRT